MFCDLDLKYNRERGVKGMFIKDIMQKKIITLGPDATIREAASLMKKNRIGYLMVVNSASLKGCITDRDIAISLADGKDPDKARVRSIMRKRVVSVRPDTDVHDATGIMAKKGVRRLPVLKDSKLLGVVTVSDLAPVLEREIDNFLHLEETYHH